MSRVPPLLSALGPLEATPDVSLACLLLRPPPCFPLCGAWSAPVSLVAALELSLVCVVGGRWLGGVFRPPLVPACASIVTTSDRGCAATLGPTSSTTRMMCLAALAGPPLSIAVEEGLVFCLFPKTVWKRWRSALRFAVSTRGGMSSARATSL